MNDQSSHLWELDRLLEGDVLADDVSRAVYATAACIYRIEPVAVVLPRHIEDVIRTVWFCREHGLPIIARGGGSGLAGQSVGRGVVIDFTRYMDAAERIDPDDNLAVVQPGITLGSLNLLLKPHNRCFPPDPSSGNYASIGGMIANNSSGGHSLRYGATIDYVRRLKFVTDTGELVCMETRPLDQMRSAQGGGREAALYVGAAKIALRYAPLIKKCMPKTSKNSSGYRLDRVIEENDPSAANIHLQRLLCGSEGTLGVIVEAELDLAAPPACTELAVLAFKSLKAAADAVPEMMKYDPSAIEAMDANAAKVVRERRAELRKFLPGEAVLLIFVEFDGADRSALREKARKLKDEMVVRRRLAFKSVDAADSREQTLLWNVRKAILPTLYNMPGPKRVISFIEDVAVPVAAIPAYIGGLGKILGENDAPFALFGHAGQGNFHVRPMLNLGDPAEVRKMAKIAEEVFELVISLGGTVSGEHGDGLVRTEFLRRQYGDLYPAFEEIKRLFDPNGIFNPGKIVDPVQAMGENLKFGPEYAAACSSGSTELVFEDGEYARLIGKCQGCGTCRTITPETSMCPVFKTLKDERISPRGKISVLREMLAGHLKPTPENRRELARVIDLCLNCGMCTSECPTLAEVSLLINEARARQSRKHGVPKVKRLISMYPALTRPMPRFVNRFGSMMLRVRPLRAVMEKFTGIDRHRRLPAIRPARKVQEVHPQNPVRRVALFADLFASLHDPEIIRCAMDILQHNGVDVIHPRQKECGIVAMTAGDLRRARKTIEFNLAGLAPAAADGRAILCTEPSAAMCLRREYRHYTTDPAAAAVAEKTREFFEFLREMKNDATLKTDFAQLDDEFLYHAPCHLAAMGIGLPAIELLRLVPGLKLKLLTKRCCGMAGSFGIAAKNYELSNEIGRPLFDEIKESKTGRLLTECSMCEMQIEERTGIEVIHPIKLLHRAYGLGK
ncbi:MAG TPA: FAD-linked oxidase C-terminal domain-containing protein [Planctomycetota bacterium]|nr:FAD-linked oxidase C-terminal domain-containing protein [Planctomycetota bacterium]